MNQVLIIEEDRLIRRRLEEILRHAGCRVSTASHGIAGLAAARRDRPDLILCGEGMERMDGYHVARLLRQRSGSPPYRFVLLFRGEAPALPAHLARGVDACLRVPATEAAVLEAALPFLADADAEPAAPWSAEVETALIDDLTGATGDLLGLVEKFLRFGELKAAVDERARTDAPALGQIHSNQVGAFAERAAAARERAEDLTVHLEKGFLPLELAELETVVGELVENACRFSRPGTPIDVFYFRQAGGCEVMVRDCGAGMTGSQVEAARTGGKGKGQGGKELAGLGLATVRLLAEARHGKLLIESIPGVGTTMRVVLPEQARLEWRAFREVDLGVPPLDEGWTEESF